MIVRPFRVSDLETYRERAAEIAARPWLSTPGLEVLETDPLARTIEIDGKPVCSGGFTDQGGGVGFAWALMADVPRQVVAGVHQVYREHLRAAPFELIEAHVAYDFHRAHRWVRLLGFDLNLISPTLLSGGTIYVMYVYRGADH